MTVKGYSLTNGKHQPEDEKPLEGFDYTMGGVFEIHPIPDSFKEGDKYRATNWKKIIQTVIQKNDIKDGLRVFIPDVVFGRGVWNATIVKGKDGWYAVGKDIIAPLIYNKEDNAWGFNSLLNTHCITPITT